MSQDFGSPTQPLTSAMNSGTHFQKVIGWEKSDLLGKQYDEKE